jgi:hypothetical protein
MVPTGVRLRLEALEVARRDAGGADKPDPPSATQLDKDERQYLSAIRQRCFQGDRPMPGSVGPAPHYLTLPDATAYTEQRLQMHREERSRVERLQATGEHVRAPAATVADCIAVGMDLPTGAATGDDWVQASVPMSLLRRAGLVEGGRDVVGLLGSLDKLLAPFGLVAEEVESLRATVAAFDALPPPPRAVMETLSRALVAGLPTVEREDRERAARGGLASRLPPPDVWSCEGWKRLREMGREVPPLSWR